ncbi:MAG: GNAT family N-acetyltransferase, partial [Pseudomonadota bacterium]
MTVRPLRAEDGADWHRLFVAGTEAFPFGFLQSPDEARTISPERAEAIVADGDWYGAFMPDGALAGFAAMRRGGPSGVRHRAIIGPVFVTADHQGTGMADRLMEGVISAARAAGVAWLDLWVAAA